MISPEGTTSSHPAYLQATPQSLGGEESKIDQKNPHLTLKKISKSNRNLTQLNKQYLQKEQKFAIGLKQQISAESHF